MNRFVSLSFFVILITNAVFPLAPEDQLTAALAAADRPAVIALLDDLRKNDPNTFENDEYDHLLGRIAADQGDTTRAVAALQRVTATESALKPYALKLLAEIARSTGNLLLERLYLIELLEFAPQSVPAKSVRSRLARNYFESSDFAEAVRILKINDPASDPDNVRGDRLLLAMSEMKLGRVENARQAFTELLDQTPSLSQPDDIALEAVINLDAMFGGIRGKQAPQLTEAEHLRRAGVYQFNREFVDARLHYQAILAGYSTATSAAEAAFQIGRGYAQQANYAEALKWYERVLEQYPASPASKEALLQAASAYGRVVRPNEAINRYELFIDRYPNDERLDRAYFNIVDIVRDQGEDTEALKRCDEIREIFKGKLPEAIALFTQVRIHFAREDWPKAIESIDKLRTFSDLGGSRVPGGTSRDELGFLRAFALEKQKRFAEATEAYLAIPDGRSEYYGWRATERLRTIAAGEDGKGIIAMEIGRAATALSSSDVNAEMNAARTILRISEDADLRKKAIEILQKHLPPLPPSLSSSAKKPTNPQKHGTPLIDKLTKLHLYDEAAAELGSDPVRSGQKTANSLDIFHRGDRADLVIAMVESIWQTVEADRPFELMPRRELEHLYPVAFRDETVSSARAFGVDPRLLLSIMRQESRFRVYAKSNAAARGLMQFISTTSNTVAAKLGREHFRQEELYVPSTALDLGSRYIADLFAAFPERTEAVVASYNGGDDNMKRWFNRARANEPERYVPEIVYSQSKDYVHKVMASYRVYQYLYDENLLPKNAE